MSSRTFTVFQDSPSSQPLRAKVLRPNVLVKRPLTNNVTSSTGSTIIVELDKENFDPVTGERSGPSNATNKKRKPSVLATKTQPLTEAKHTKRDPSSPPEKKKRKPSSSSATVDPKPGKRFSKISGSSRKGIKRAGSKKASLLPRLTEEDEVSAMLLTQEVIDSRCKDLTLKPLADVSDAYDGLCVLETLSSVAEAPDDRLEPRTVKVRLIFWGNLPSMFTHVFHICSHHLLNLRFVITLSRPGTFFRHLQPPLVSGQCPKGPLNHAHSQRRNESKSTRHLYFPPLPLRARSNFRNLEPVLLAENLHRS